MPPLPQTSEYRIPKLEISAEVSLLGQPRKVVKLFLNERAETHSGPEKPSDLLNGPSEFFPAIEPPGKLVILHRDSVTVLSVAAECEFPPEESGQDPSGPEAASQIGVELILQDGMEIRGTVRFVMPEGRRRLIDFLNTTDRFLIVRMDGLARLINKRRIVRVAVVESREGKRDPWP